MRAKRIALLTLALGCGAPTVARPLVAPTPSPAPPSSRATWTFELPLAPHAKLELAAMGTLFVGEGGRRSLRRPDGSIVDATTLATSGLAGAITAGGRFAFVTPDGSVFTSSDPLGPLDAPRVPAEPLERATTGRGAIVAVRVRDRALVRSADLGVTWQTIAYAGAPAAWGAPESFRLDSRGNGLLLHLPERLFVTHDDGATWTPIAFDRKGRGSVTLDAHDELSYEDRYSPDARRDVLSGVSLIPSKAPAVKLTLDPTKQPYVPREWRSLLVGDHVVTFEQEDKRVRVRSTPLAEPGAPAGLASDFGESNALPALSAYGDAILAVRETRLHTSEVLESQDLGATWATVATLDANTPSRVVLGPQGWAFVGGMASASAGGGWLRPAGDHELRPFDFGHGFAPDSFVFDEVHGRVYALGRSVNASPAPLSVRWASLSGDSFEDAGPAPHALYADELVGGTVDASGTLRAFVREAHRGLAVLTRLPDGTFGPLTHLVDAHLDGAYGAFAGARGLLSGYDGTFETSDGGASWTQVGGGGTTPEQCDLAGCRFANARRVGWDLPALARGRLVATVVEPETSPAPTAAPTLPQPAGSSLDCRVTRVVPVDEPADLSDPERAIARTSVRTSAAGLEITRWDRGTQSTVRVRTTPDKPFELLETERGVAATRPLSAPTASWRDQVAELVWMATGDGVLRRAKIAPGKHVRATLAGETVLLEGTGDPMLVRDNDTTRDIARPLSGPMDRRGGRLLFSQTRDGGAKLEWSDDDGQSWSTTSFWLASSGPVRVRALAGGVALALLHDDKAPVSGGAALFVTDPNAATPPQPTLVDLSTAATPCGDEEGVADETLGVAQDRVTARAGAKDAPLSASRRIVRALATGKTCTAAYELESPAARALLYPDGAGWTGWLYRRSATPDVAPFVADALTCR